MIRLVVRFILIAALVRILPVCACAEKVMCDPSLNQYFPPSVLPLSGVVRLIADYNCAYDVVTIDDGTIIETQGHEYDLEIDQKLEIKGTAILRAFDPTIPTPSPPKAGNGDSVSGVADTADRNCTKRQSDEPGADAQCMPLKGRSGRAGQDGEVGRPGHNGRDAGTIHLILGSSATADGMLVIDNRGEAGGPGGPGGDGSRGEVGGDGGDAVLPCDRPRFVGSFPVVAVTEVEGGMGGWGGVGGDGGEGSGVVIQMPPDEAQDNHEGMQKRRGFRRSTGCWCFRRFTWCCRPIL